MAIVEQTGPITIASDGAVTALTTASDAIIDVAGEQAEIVIDAASVMGGPLRSLELNVPDSKAIRIISGRGEMVAYSEVTDSERHQWPNDLVHTVRSLFTIRANRL